MHYFYPKSWKVAPIWPNDGQQSLAANSARTVLI